MSAKPRVGVLRVPKAPGIPKIHWGRIIDANGMDSIDRWNHKNRCERARKLGLPEPPLPIGLRTGGAQAPPAEAPEDRSTETIRTMAAEIAQLKAKVLDHSVIRRVLLGLAAEHPPIPEWLTRPVPAGSKGSPGVPTLFLSDWHWGEVVDPDQIGGVNEFDLAIGKTRAERVVERTVAILKHHMAHPSYPGLVVALGGDMLTGDIHEELRETNEMPTIPALLDLWGVLRGLLVRMADEFGQVFVPCVTGNHGRTTPKMRFKGRNWSNYDWLLYSFLEATLKADDRITFLVAPGADVSWRVYGHRYLMVHGDQLGKGGDGIIGALGPIIRGDHRKRSKESQIGRPYDTLLVGHWHQLVQMPRVIVNGSLKGYDEYAHGWSFPWEPPRQALWLTHRDRGITAAWPVQLEDPTTSPTAEWVSIRRPA